MTIAVDYAGGPPIPGSLAAQLSAGCLVTIQATGAQSLAPRCMRYDGATGLFGYRWRLRPRGAGEVRLGVKLLYQAAISRWQHITISP